MSTSSPGIEVGLQLIRYDCQSTAEKMMFLSFCLAKIIAEDFIAEI